MNKAQLALLHEEINTLWNKLKNKNLSLKEFNDLAAQIRNCYINTPNKDYKEYKGLKNRFFNEVEALRRVTMYLQEKGEAPKNINFCAHDQEYDGIFYWENHQVCLEITRAADDNSGQNEQHARELLEKRGMAPYAQQIDAEGTKNKRTFGRNEPIARRIETSEFSGLLQTAFDHKNNKKYRDFWLIITLPLHWGQDLIFYKSCLEFWDAINQNCGVFKRIFVVSEEGIKSDSFDKGPIWDSAHNDLYEHYADL